MQVVQNSRLIALKRVERQEFCPDLHSLRRKEKSRASILLLWQQIVAITPFLQEAIEVALG
jgi:hypothetical protein